MRVCSLLVCRLLLFTLAITVVEEYYVTYSVSISPFVHAQGTLQFSVQKVEGVQSYLLRWSHVSAEGEVSNLQRCTCLESELYCTPQMADILIRF